MAVLKIVLSFAIALILWPVLNLLKFYIEARTVGAPVIINPIGLLNPIWIITHKTFLPWIKNWPFGLGDWVLYSGTTSIFTNRYKLHERHGPAYVVATPNEVALFIDDPELAEEVMSKRKDLIKSERMGTALNLFGPNVVTTDGEVWARNRRITTPPFNERISNNIWKESLAQATGSKFYTSLILLLLSASPHSS